MTNGQAIGVIDVANEIQEKDIPVKTAYRIYDIVGKVNDSYMTYMKTLNSLMKKAGVDSPDDPKINGRVMELLNMEVDVDVKPLNRSELLDSGINLSLSQLVRFDPVVKNDG